MVGEPSYSKCGPRIHSLFARELVKDALPWMKKSESAFFSLKRRFVIFHFRLCWVLIAARAFL